MGRNDSLSKIHDECDALFLVNPGTEILFQNREYTYRIFWKPPGMLGTCIGVESAQSSAEIFSGFCIPKIYSGSTVIKNYNITRTKKLFGKKMFKLLIARLFLPGHGRSEERRVGKECRSRW